MARVHPPISEIRALSAGEHAELEVLALLAGGLPEDYELFHSVDWTRAEQHKDSHGELDVVVINNAGDIAVLEVKAGEVEIHGGDVFKQYGGQLKDIGRQASWQFGSILQRLKAEGLNVRLLHCLVLPHHRVGSEGTIGYPRERIADADDCKDLAWFIQHRLGAGRPDPMKERVCAFLLDRMCVQPDISAMDGTLQRRVDAIAGGLASWVPRVRAPSGVIHVQATAGSGKTQLALGLLRRARVAQETASYVCFNRPLADQMREIAPSGVEVKSFHQLCWEAAGRPVAPRNFEELVRSYRDSALRANPDLDLLVIDELQDMHAEWVQTLSARVRDKGQIYLLDDPEQCVYPDRVPIEIEDAVLITARENYRSPRKIANTINLFRLTNEPIVSCAPLAGVPPEFTLYDSTKGSSLARATADAVRRCLSQGYALQDILVLCWRGREHSALLREAVLADWRLAKFAGAYDDRGQPIWSDGELRIETVRRFKGQSAPAIVLTEVDFDEADTLWPRLLFVALTRARMHVEVVSTETAAHTLEQRLTVEGGKND
ncbi:ATP-binding domain-containing protein [Paraburkholderia sp. A3BS-1L]|uniref:AAA family ATPase n=1 Tax=Paraburkholderia sp. A3BS-1L TaxID=3028375 RepID=UPI003DA9EF00